ncbi:pentapeptide repeat-containing protein [Alkalihalobacterium elongatum]|uniref:pentapeptide repeat-containing protein n=1 Tax=Alkalihalobacterium elongatum TaxID=2675466 RepID=UPI001C1F48CA|nr:pentapeptide repeat-containing protein [Alkalihalobacterium elongatum]
MKNLFIDYWSVLLVVFLYSVFVILASVYFYEFPQSKSFGIYNSEDSWIGLLINLNSSIIDFLVFSFIVVILINKQSSKMQRNTEVKINKELLEINREQEGQHVALMNVITLKKLINLGCKNINLSKICFNETSLSQINLNNSKLMGARFFNCTLKNSTLEECNFKGAIFKEAKLSNVNFINCNLRNGHFSNSKAKGVIFKNCDLYKCDFSDSNLKNADFRGASLEHINFIGANLSHANFKNVKNLDLEKLKQAKLLNKIKIDRQIYDDLKKQYPEKFNSND